MSKAGILFVIECGFLVIVATFLLNGEALWSTPAPVVPWLDHALIASRRWWDGRIATLYPEPEGSFLAGLLFGERTSVPRQLIADFRSSGLLHVMALSGYNVSLIANAVSAFVLAIGASRRVAFFGTTGLLFFFILATGAPASVIRAGVMGFCVLLARETGRPHRIRYLLAFAAVAMVALQPAVFGQLGFQLSFLATIGLTTVGSWLQPRLGFLTEKFALRETAAATLGATLATTPLTVYTFGTLSLIGPVANLFILPTIPLVTIAGFFSLVPFVGEGSALFVWYGLRGVEGVVHWFANVPFAVIRL